MKTQMARLLHIILVFGVLQEFTVASIGVDEVRNYNFTISTEEKIQRGYLPDGYLYFTNLVESYGYKGMQYEVTTEDGYILKLFRMQSRKCEKLNQVPVLLMHGLFMNGESWFVSGPELGLPYVITDACHDLWIGNSRGTDLGRGHVRLDPDRQADFWDFSIHELGVYDQPAIIDFILSETNVPKLNFIGFSSGGGQLLITLSERPEYINKVNFYVGLAPNFKFQNMEAISLRGLFVITTLLSPVLKTFGIYELLFKGSIIQMLAETLCNDLTFTEEICFRFIEFDSFHPDSLTSNTLRSLFPKLYMGASVKTMIHDNQIQSSGEFRPFDYGTIKNLQVYKQLKPPSYKFGNFQVPSLILRGVEDTIIVYEDLADATSKLPNVIEFRNITTGNWNHMNTIAHKDWPSVFVDYIQDHLLEYSKI